MGSKGFGNSVNGTRLEEIFWTSLLKEIPQGQSHFNAQEFHDIVDRARQNYETDCTICDSESLPLVAPFVDSKI